MKRSNGYFAVAIASLAVVAVSPALAATIDVDAKSDIFLAGLATVPTGFGASGGFPGPGAGVLPPSVDVVGGGKVTLDAAGTVSCCGGAPSNGPDGGGLGGAASIHGYGNVGPYKGVEFALLGVFGGPSLHKPWRVRLIGHHATLTVPKGATELYLGFADSNGFGGAPGYYNDNTGGLSVEITK